MRFWIKQLNNVARNGMLVATLFIAGCTIETDSPSVNNPSTNSSPEPVGTIVDQTLNVGGRSTVEVAGYFRDVDEGDMLDYDATTDNGNVVTMELAAGSDTLTLMAVDEGNAMITVTATDSGGLNARQTFMVTVADSMPPGSPSGITAAIISPTSIRLSWTNPDDDDLAAVSITSDPVLTIPEVDATDQEAAVQSATIANVAFGTEYAFTIRTRDDDGNVRTPGTSIAALRTGLLLNNGTDLVISDNDPAIDTFSLSEEFFAVREDDSRVFFTPTEENSTRIDILQWDQNNGLALQAIPVISDTNNRGLGNRFILVALFDAGSPNYFKARVATAQPAIAVRARALTPVSELAIVSHSRTNACYVLDDTVACVGYNNASDNLPILGNDIVRSTDTVRYFVPIDDSGIDDRLSNGIRSLSMGENHVCAVSHDDDRAGPVGTPYCWGNDARGQLGNGSNSHQSVPGTIDAALLPMGTSIIGNTVSVAVGRYHTCILLANQHVYCWGESNEGRLGDGILPSLGDRTAPQTAVLDIADAMFLDAGASHNCAIRSNGKIACWGNDDDGRLGNGTTAGNTEENSPTDVLHIGMSTAQESNAIAMSAGTSHTCAIIAANTSDTSGAAVCWGKQDNGRLGNGSIAVGSVDSPQINVDRIVSVMETGGSNLDRGVTAISAGRQNTCAIHNLVVKCWGSNLSGQLGLPAATIESGVAVVVPGLDGFTPIGLSQGHNSDAMCAFDINGNARCWGEANNGILGDGSQDDAFAITSGVYNTIGLGQ